MLDIDTYIQRLEKKESKLQFIEEEYNRWVEQRDDDLQYLKDLEVVRKLIQKAAHITQKQLKFSIEKVVSSALAAVFDDPYKFRVDFVKRRNTTECDLLFERNGKTRRPLDGCGYGAADIASLALRVVYWKLDGTARNTLILDEPLRNLSLDKHPLAALMIKKLSETGLQFIIITHNKSFYGDKRFIVGKKNGISYVSEIKEIA